jgi:uncharacterized protein Yka (UPF0111/DUF47 family)
MRIVKPKRKSVIKGFRISETEAEELSRRAAEAGMSESDYLRLCIKSSPNDFPEIRKAIKQLINEINSIGVNVNQIARNSNSGFFVPDDKVRLFAYMSRLSSLMNKVVEDIGDM